MEVFSVLCAWRWHPWLPQLQIADITLVVKWHKKAEHGVEISALYKSQTLRKSHVIRKDHWLESWIFFFGHQVLWTSRCRYSSGISQLVHDESFLFCSNMSLKAHGGCSMLSLFFQENVSSQFLFLSFTPLCHLAALLLCLWHHEILWVLSHTIVAIVDMVDIQLSCAFISIIKPSQPAEKHLFQTYVRHERNRYEFPHMHLAKVRPDSSTHHQLSRILDIASWQDTFQLLVYNVY